MRGAKLAALVGAFSMGLPACALQAEEEMAASEVACSLAQLDGKEFSSEEICDLFRAELAGSHEELAAIELATVTKRSARARALASDGTVLLELDHDVTDAELSTATWADLARALASELKKL